MFSLERRILSALRIVPSPEVPLVCPAAADSPTASASVSLALRSFCGSGFRPPWALRSWCRPSPHPLPTPLPAVACTGGAEGSPVAQPMRIGAWNILEPSRLYLPLNHLYISYVIQGICMGLLLDIHTHIYYIFLDLRNFFPKP